MQSVRLLLRSSRTFPSPFTTGLELKPEIINSSWIIGGLRSRHSKKVNFRAQKFVEGGVSYPGDITYFPRTQGEEEPPIEPSKLFMVKRIRSVKGKPYWDKDIIKKLGIEARGDVAIVKNTPANNNMLYRVKHLVEVTPITIPYGMPDDPRHGFLKENGEFVSYNSLEGHKLQIEEAKSMNDALLKKSVDGATLKKRLRDRWYQRTEMQ